eukprot:scaffold150834_cov32-Tisochrysis_lutea.AAC.2
MLDHLVGARQGYWVCVIRGPPSKRVRIKPSAHLLAHSDACEGKVGTREALGARDNVRHHPIIVLKAPQLARPPESHHNLISDVQDTILVAQRTHSLYVARRVDKHPTGADNRLQHERRDGVRAFRHDLLLERRERNAGGCLLVLPPLK